MIARKPLRNRGGALDQHREPADRLGQPLCQWQLAAEDSGQGLWHERAGTRPLKVLGSSGHNSRARAIRTDARLVASVYNPDNTSKRRGFFRALQVKNNREAPIDQHYQGIKVNFGSHVLRRGAERADRLWLAGGDE